jgi:hypothetical protein
MKARFIFRLASLAAWLLPPATVAETVGIQPPERVILDSPCDLQAAAWESQSLLVATVTGQAGSISPGQLMTLLGLLDNDALTVHHDELDCWSTEAAFYESILTNQGSPGQSQTAAYVAAYEQLAADVSVLRARPIPGESPFDVTANDEILGFYSSGYDAMAANRHMVSVRGLQSALVGAMSSLEQIAQPCRLQSYLQGTEDCAALDSALAQYTTAFEGLVETATPQVASLTASLDSLAATASDLLSALQKSMGNAQQIQALLPVYLSDGQAEFYYFGLNAWWYEYWLGYANYAAALGAWGAFYQYLSLASGALYWAEVCLGAGQWYQAAAMQMGSTLNQLQAAIPSYQQALKDNNNQTNVTKGQLRNLPVGGMLSL